MSPINGGDDHDVDVTCSGQQRRRKRRACRSLVLSIDLTLSKQGFTVIPFLCRAHKTLQSSVGSYIPTEDATLHRYKVHLSLANRNRTIVLLHYLSIFLSDFFFQP